MVLQFRARIRVESKGFPGVAYVVKRMSPARRAEFWAANAGYRARLRELRQEQRPLDDELTAAREKQERQRKAEVERLAGGGMERAHAEQEATAPLEMDAARLVRLIELRAEEKKLDEAMLKPNLVRMLVESIEGLEIEGAPATVETLIAEGHDGLFDEIAEACAMVMELPADALGNLQWPAISAGVEGRPMPNTSAMSANETGTTSEESAGAISPSL